jgi:hypothetical protein
MIENLKELVGQCGTVRLGNHWNGTVEKMLRLTSIPAL